MLCKNAQKKKRMPLFSSQYVINYLHLYPVSQLVNIKGREELNFKYFFVSGLFSVAGLGLPEVCLEGL